MTVFRYKAVIPGNKIFMREYELETGMSLFRLHEFLDRDLGFSPDQMTVFETLSGKGEIMRRIGLFDFGDGSMDRVSVEDAFKDGAAVRYVYNMGKGLSLELRFVSEAEYSPRRSYPVLVLGPTAVGKTDYAIELAKEYGSPVISCDSRQIFREMRIGTAPPSEEQLRQVRHYFIFSHSVADHYSAGRYELEAMALLSGLFKEHDRLVMVGGSGLYADAVCYGFDDFPPADQDLRRKLTERAMSEGVGALAEELRELDPESYAAIDLSNRQRVVRALEVTLSTGRKFSSFKTNPQKKRFFNVERKILTMPREELYARIDRRAEKMFEAGLVDEVHSLAAYRDMPALRTVGYSEVFDYLDGNVSLDEAVELVKRNTRRYAKRQITWFNRYL